MLILVNKLKMYTTKIEIIIDTGNKDITFLSLKIIEVNTKYKIV